MAPHVLFCDSLPFWGGGEHWIVMLATALARRDWRTAVAGRRGSALLLRAHLAGVETHDWAFRRDFDLSTILAAAKYLRRERPDLVVVTTGRDIRTVGLAARRYGIPVIWRMGLPPRHRWVHRVTGRYVVGHVIAPSHHVRSTLEDFDWLRGKITVIANGITAHSPPDEARIQDVRAQLGWADGDQIILYVGRLLRVKGVDVLLAAFASLRMEFPRARLVCVGTGPESERFRLIVKAHGMEEAVCFAGYTTDPSAYFDGCDIFVLPSRAETFGFVLLEAMARAKPVVATRVGGIPEATGEAARLVAADDPAGLARELRDLLGDAERRRYLGEAGAQRVRSQFTAERMTDEVAALFENILMGRAREAANPPTRAGQL